MEVKGKGHVCATLAPSKELMMYIDMGLGWLQVRTGGLGEDKNLLLLLVIETVLSTLIYLPYRSFRLIPEMYKTAVISVNCQYASPTD